MSSPDIADPGHLSAYLSPNIPDKLFTTINGQQLKFFEFSSLVLFDQGLKRKRKRSGRPSTLARPRPFLRDHYQALSLLSDNMELLLT